MSYFWTSYSPKLALAARVKQTFGETVLAPEASAAIRDSNRGER
jgi:hypothetical protein